MGILDIFRGSANKRIAQRLIEEVRKLGETRKMQFDLGRDAVLVTGADGSEANTWNLYNLRFEIERAPAEDHDDIYRRWARACTEPRSTRSDDYASVRPRLRVAIKDAAYPDFIAFMNSMDGRGGKTPRGLYRPIGGDLIGCAVEETDENLVFLTEDDPPRWQVSAQQVLDDAFANTSALPAEFDLGKFAYYVDADDVFVSSRLLCEQQIRALPLRGLPVVLVPDRGTLFIVGSEDHANLEGIARYVIDEFHDISRHVSGRLCVLTPQGWREFTPPEPARIACGNLARMYDAMNWTEYQALLEKDLEARDEDVFVAKITVVEDQDTGAYITSIVWSRDVDSIFPTADRVYFFDSNDESVRYADWADVVRVMGEQMTPMDGAPSRYRVRAFPTSAQFLAMSAQLRA